MQRTRKIYLGFEVRHTDALVADAVKVFRNANEATSWVLSGTRRYYGEIEEPRAPRRKVEA